MREAFSIYERGAPELRAIRRERDVHPRVAEAGSELEASLDALVEARWGRSTPRTRTAPVARAMIDLGTWQALRDQGLGPAEAVAAIAGLLAGRLTARQP